MFAATNGGGGGVFLVFLVVVALIVITVLGRKRRFTHEKGTQTGKWGEVQEEHLRSYEPRHREDEEPDPWEEE